MRWIFLTLIAFKAAAATYYVDSAATGSNTGVSWSNAWTNMDAIGTLSAGDVVYISGGPSGASQNYTVNSLGTNYPGIWVPQSGTVGNPITYKIGQDSAHNGTAKFVGSGTYSGGGYWLGYQVTPRPHDIVISGDAGDGQQHFCLTNYGSIGAASGYVNARIAYVNCGIVASGIDFNPGTGIEFDHNYALISDTNSDHFSSATFSDTVWGTNSIHHCEIHLPYRYGVSSSGGNGPDGLQWNGTGFSIYKNTFVGYVMTGFNGNQHQDGWQSTGNGGFIKVYDNTFINIANYPIYVEPAFGGFTNVVIYNNLACITDTNLISGGSQQGIVVAGGTTNPAVNVSVFNNTVMDYPGNGLNAITFRNPNNSNLPSAFSNCICANNVSINSGVSIIDPNVVTNANIEITTAGAASNFTSYNSFAGTNNNLHLLSTATGLIGTGTNLYSLAVADFEGNARSASGAWDVGLYVYQIQAQAQPRQTTRSVFGGSAKIGGRALFGN